MALASASLTNAITKDTMQFVLSSISSSTMLPTVGAPPLSVGVPMLIDSEMMFVVSQPVAGTVVVRGRGSDGTAVVGHDVLANVYFSSSASDFGTPAAGFISTIDPTDDVAVSIGQDGAIAIPTTNTAVNINKATAAALTLAAPSLASNGVTMVITTQTAAAHVITATTLLADGASGSPHTTATFLAQKGASITLMAENGLWNVTALQNVTVS